MLIFKCNIHIFSKLYNCGLQEEVNEATVQYVGVVLDPLKPRISCQYPHFAQTEDIGLKSALEEKTSVLLITACYIVVEY